VTGDPAEVAVATAPDWLLGMILGAGAADRKERRARMQVPPEIHEGERETTLFRLGCSLRAQGFGEEAIAAALLETNREQVNPLTEAEVMEKAANACKYERGGQQNATWRRTELGMAERFRDLQRDRVRWCNDMGKWLVWTGTRWAPAAGGEVVRLAKEVVLGMYAEAGLIADDKERAAFLKFVAGMEKDRALNAILSLAESELPLPVRAADLDSDGWVLNCENGLLDLRTGELKPHRPEDLCLKQAPVSFDPTATAPTWLVFLDRIMAGNSDLIGFLQRAVGASLPAHTREQVLLILHGRGANGKSTFMGAIMGLFGPYAVACEPQTLLARKDDGAVRNDVARLCGARLVSTTETGQGKRLDENLVKKLTGGDTQTARFLFREYFEFVPAFRPWLATNHKPEIRGTDLAIWRRIRLVPFDVSIPEGEQDATLPERLRAELPGILNWALEGCIAWQAYGLGAPEEVKQATAAYRAESDAVGQFLEACCILGDAFAVKSSDLRDAYVAWCAAERETALTSRAFADRLKEKGLVSDRGAKGARHWKGIGLIAG